MGLREEKKVRTRRCLVREGLRLFDQHGFEETPVRMIAAACDVSPATVYTYFPAKDDLVFPDRTVHAELFAQTLAARDPGQGPHEVLVDGVRRLLVAGAWSIDPDDPLATARGRVIAASPALRGRALAELAALHQQWTVLLHDAFTPRLDESTAAAQTGAVLGAVVAIVTHHLQHADDHIPDLSALVDHALKAIDPASRRTSVD